MCSQGRAGSTPVPSTIKIDAIDWKLGVISNCRDTFDCYFFLKLKSKITSGRKTYRVYIPISGKHIQFHLNSASWSHIAKSVFWSGGKFRKIAHHPDY